MAGFVARRTPPLVLAGLVSVVLAACAEEIDPTPATMQPPPTSVPDTPTPVVVPSPSSTPTAAETIAELVARVVAGDADALADYLAPREIDGMQRIPFAGCEATLVSPEEAVAVLSQVLLARGPQFHAAMRAEPGAAEQAFPLGPYAVVFQTLPPAGIEQPTGVLLAVDAGGRIHSFRTGCRATPERLAGAVPGAQPVELPTPRP